MALGIKLESLFMSYACMAHPCLTLFTSPPPSTCFIHWTSTTDLKHTSPSTNPGESLRFVEHSRKTSPWADGDTDREAHCSIVSALKTKHLKTNAHQQPDGIIIVYSYYGQYQAETFFQTFFLPLSTVRNTFTGLDNPLIDKVADPSP